MLPVNPSVCTLYFRFHTRKLRHRWLWPKLGQTCAFGHWALSPQAHILSHSQMSGPCVRFSAAPSVTLGRLLNLVRFGLHVFKVELKIVRSEQCPWEGSGRRMFILSVHAVTFEWVVAVVVLVTGPPPPTPGSEAPPRADGGILGVSPLRPSPESPASARFLTFCAGT